MRTIYQRVSGCWSSTVVICCVRLSAGVLWAIGQTLFPFQANGSIVRGPDGKPVGSLLIAQPFTKDEYFQPRPSAASYDASASASSTLAASNYALRDRVARTLGPIVKYKSGAKKPASWSRPTSKPGSSRTRPAASRISSRNGPTLHNSLAQGWVTGDPTHAAYVDAWAKAHDDVGRGLDQEESGARRSRRPRISPSCSSRISPTTIPASSRRR